MHLDNLMPLKKEKLYLPPTPFSAMPHHEHFQTKNIDKSIAFFKYTGL